MGNAPYSLATAINRGSKVLVEHGHEVSVVVVLVRVRRSACLIREVESTVRAVEINVERGLCRTTLLIEEVRNLVTVEGVDAHVVSPVSCVAEAVPLGVVCLAPA